jgi:hypothetical protein
MPQDDRARTAEAIRRIAPDLLALNRYERPIILQRFYEVSVVVPLDRSRIPRCDLDR